MKQVLSGTLGVQLDALADYFGLLEQPLPLALLFGLRLGGLAALLEELFLLDDLLAEHHEHLLCLLVEAALDGLAAEGVVDANLGRDQGFSGPLHKVLVHLVLHAAGDLLAEQAHHQVDLCALLCLRLRAELGGVDLVEKFLPVVF